jgi:transcriptional regulator with XRE-family HTH domain
MARITKLAIQVKSENYQFGHSRKARVFVRCGMSEDDDEPKELPQLFIRERMKTKGITGVVAAERMSTTPATVSRLLNGKRRMTLGWLYAFAKALEEPIASLFYAPDDPSIEIPRDQIWPTLLRMEGVSPRSAELGYFALTGTDAPIAPKQEQLDVDDLPESANRHHESAPSQRR